MLFGLQLSGSMCLSKLHALGIIHRYFDSSTMKGFEVVVAEMSVGSLAEVYHPVGLDVDCLGILVAKP